MENTVNYLPQGRSLSTGPSPSRWCAVRPNCLLTSWAKIGAITLRPGCYFSSRTSFVVSRRAGKRKEKDQPGEEDEEKERQIKERNLE